MNDGVSVDPFLSAYVLQAQQELQAGAARPSGAPQPADTRTGTAAAPSAAEHAPPTQAADQHVAVPSAVAMSQGRPMEAVQVQFRPTAAAGAPPSEAAAAREVRGGYHPEILRVVDNGGEAALPASCRIPANTPYDLNDPAGQAAALDSLQQLAASNGVEACGATCVVAAALNAGTDGLRALAEAVSTGGLISLPPAVAERLRSGHPTAGDMNHLIDSVYRDLQIGDLGHDMTAQLVDFLHDKAAEIGAQRSHHAAPTAPDHSYASIMTDTIEKFVQQHHLEGLFGPQCQLKAIDNRGDGAAHHGVLQLQGPNGEPRIFDPMTRANGHQLVTDPHTVRMYERATIMTVRMPTAHH